MSILGYVRLGKSLRNLGRTEEAIAAFERAAELDPANSDTVASLESLREILDGENCILSFVFSFPYFIDILVYSAIIHSEKKNITFFFMHE